MEESRWDWDQREMDPLILLKHQLDPHHLELLLCYATMITNHISPSLTTTHHSPLATIISIDHWFVGFLGPGLRRLFLWLRSMKRKVTTSRRAQPVRMCSELRNLDRLALDGKVMLRFKGSSCNCQRVPSCILYVRRFEHFAGWSCETSCFAERARGDVILFEANSITARTWICIDIVNFYFGLLSNVFCWYLRNYLVHVCLFKLFLASTPSRSRPGNRTIQVNDIFQSYRWLLKSSTCLASNCDPKELQRESEHGKQVWKPGDVSMKAMTRALKKPLIFVTWVTWWNRFLQYSSSSGAKQ